MVTVPGDVGVGTACSFQEGGPKGGTDHEFE